MSFRRLSGLESPMVGMARRHLDEIVRGGRSLTAISLPLPPSATVQNFRL
jgi:hypothetical protein